MRVAARWSFVLLLGMVGVGSMAQQELLQLTESAAVDLALKNHPMVRMAAAQAGMAQARVGIARSEGALQVSANALAAASSMRNVIAVPSIMPQAILQSQDRASVDLNGMAMLPLYTGGRIQQSVRVARLTADAAQDQTALARTQVAFEARIRFAEWRQALAMLTVAQDTLTAQTRNAQVAQQLFEVGKVPRFDLLRAQAAQASARQLVANAQAEVSAARAQLAQALNIPSESLAAPAEEAVPEAPSEPLPAALARRPELLAAQKTIASAEAAVDARKANYRPQVYAVGMVDAVAPSDMGKSSGLTVGVVAGIPILDGGRRRAEVEEAQQAVAEAQAARNNVELQVRAEVAIAEARVTAARQNIETASTQVTAAEEAYTVAQARYAAARGTIVELLDAQQARTESRQNLVAAQAQYGAALADLYRAMGIDIVRNG